MCVEVLHKSIVIEVRVVFEQTLHHLVSLLVVHHVVESVHHLLNDAVDNVNRESFHAHVQNAAALDVACQRHHMPVHCGQQS